MHTIDKQYTTDKIKLGNGNTHLMHTHLHLRHQALQVLQCQNQEQFFLLMSLGLVSYVLVMGNGAGT